MRMRIASMGAAAAALVVVAGCSTTVSGQAATSSSAAAGTSSDSAAQPTVNVDSGAFATTRRTIAPATGTAAYVLEGNRMADAIVLGTDVDPRLHLGGAQFKRAYPVVDAAQLATAVPDATVDVFTDNNMRVGMTTTRADSLTDPTVALRIGLYRFDSDDTAKKVVSGVAAATASAKQVKIEAAPGGTASEFKPGTVDTYLARGPIVINISGTATTTAAAAQLVNRAYQMEVAKLEGFTPTPIMRIPSLPVDHDGILSRTLPSESMDDANSYLLNGWLTLTGLLHKITDLDKADVYRKAGVDLIGMGDGVVYRAKDSGGANYLLQNVYTGKPAASPKQLPSMRCVDSSTDTTALFHCGVAVGRYWADENASDLITAQQKAAAEYKILSQG